MWHFFEHDGRGYRELEQSRYQAWRVLNRSQGLPDTAEYLGAQEAEQPEHYYQVDGVIGEECFGFHRGWWRIVDETGQRVGEEPELWAAQARAARLNECAVNTLHQQAWKQEVKHLAANRHVFDL